MPDPINDTIAALTAAGANDDEITAIIKEKFGGWRPGADSLSSIKLRGVQGPISDTPEKEPDTYWGGFFRSLKNEFSPSTVRDNLIKSPAMQGAAHPETAGDVASLLIPSGIEGAMSAAGTMRRSLGGAIKPGSKLKDVPRQVIERVRDRWTDPLDLGERAMRDAPLHQQMNILEGPPVKAEAVRTGTPPYRPEPPPVPFHERPLYQQMNDLPETQAPILGRGADAPYQPTPTLAKPTGPPPVLRKEPTVDEILIDKLTETPEGPTRVSAAPEPTITSPGREGEFQSTGRPAAGLDPDIESTIEAAAARREAARAEPTPRRSTPAETSAEPSVLEQQLRDSLAAERGVPDPNAIRTIRQLHGSKTAGQVLDMPQQGVKTASGASTSAFPEVPRARIDTWLAEHPNASPAELKAYIHAKGSNALSKSYIKETLKRSGMPDEEIAALGLPE